MTTIKITKDNNTIIYGMGYRTIIANVFIGTDLYESIDYDIVEFTDDLNYRLGTDWEVICN